jgi:hypothetical protein
MKQITPSTPPSGGYRSPIDLVQAINAFLAFLTIIKRTPEQREARRIRKAERRRQRRLDDLEDESADLMQAYRDGTITSEIYFQLSDDLRARREAMSLPIT